MEGEGEIRHGHDIRALFFFVLPKTGGVGRDRGGWRTINKYNSMFEIPKFDIDWF